MNEDKKDKEYEDKLKCKNTKCKYNSEGFCKILTQIDTYQRKIRCEEREW